VYQRNGEVERVVSTYPHSVGLHAIAGAVRIAHVNGSRRQTLLWAAGVGGVYAVAVALNTREGRVAVSRWLHDSRGWADTLTVERLARSGHEIVNSAQRDVIAAVAVLERIDPAAAAGAREAFDAARERAKRALDAWQAGSSDELWEAADHGFLGGAPVFASPRSDVALRRFATYANTPRWLPRWARRRVVPALRLIDVVRLVHTPTIERQALISTLWVRAAVVSLAPLAAGLSLTGLVPLRTDDALQALAFGAAAGASVGSALFATRIADYTIGQPTRWRLYAAEQVIAVLAVVAAPCWPTAVYAAGAVNWLERPDWTLRKLLIWMAVTYVPFAAAGVADGAPVGLVAGEAALGVVVTAIMAGSYGLLGPLTLFVAAQASWESLTWRARAFRMVRRDQRDMLALIDRIRGDLLQHQSDDADAFRAAEHLKATRDQVRRRTARSLWRPRRLDRLVSHAITRYVPPDNAKVPEGETPPRLVASRVIEQPTGAASRVVASSGDARRLEKLIGAIVQEAVDKGATGRLVTYARDVEDRGVQLEIANVKPSDATTGFSTGDRWLQRHRIGIVDVEVTSRGVLTTDHPDLVGEVFSVTVQLGPGVFEDGSRTS
jgi:hypothetical protein